MEGAREGEHKSGKKMARKKTVVIILVRSKTYSSLAETIIISAYSFRKCREGNG